MKGDIKTVGLVAVGVLVAGALMYQLRNSDFVDNIRTGFGN